MRGRVVPITSTSGLDRMPARSRWRYQGVGWPGSLGEIRFGVVAVIVIVAATIWGYVFIGPRGRIEAGRIDDHKTDFTVFTEAGAAFFDGRDPYGVTNPRGWHYLYPPLFALLVAPLSVFDTESQVVAWYVLNVGLLFGCFTEARRLWSLVAGPTRKSPFAPRRGGEARRPWSLVAGAPPARLPGIAVCCGLASVLPFLDCMQAGQLGIAILYLLMVGFRLVVEGRSWPRWFLGGLVLALPSVIKLVPSLPVGFLVFQQWSAVVFRSGGRRPLGRATTLTAGVLTGGFLFLLAIPASLLGWEKNLAFLRLWHERIVTNERVGPDANFNIHSFRNQSLANAVYLWGRSTARTGTSGSQPSPPPDRPERMAQPRVRVGIGVILALLLAVGLAVGRRNDRLDQATAYGLACCAMLLVSPLSWGHYYMAELPAILCVPIWLARRGSLRLAQLAAVIPPVLSWSYYVAMPYTGGLGLLGIGTTAWFLGSCAAILGIEVAAAGRVDRLQG
jgi:hypothetical protein